MVAPTAPAAVPLTVLAPPARPRPADWRLLAAGSAATLALGAVTLVSAAGLEDGSPQQTDRLWTGGALAGAGVLIGLSVPILRAPPQDQP